MDKVDLLTLKWKGFREVARRLARELRYMEHLLNKQTSPYFHATMKKDMLRASMDNAKPMLGVFDAVEETGTHQLYGGIPWREEDTVARREDMEDIVRLRHLVG